VNSLREVENLAAIARVTCGWRKAGLNLDSVRRYWRDVHSPAIARRAGVYHYIHLQFGAVDAALFNTVAAIGRDAPADAQLQWLSDVRYRDEAGLAAFGGSPGGVVKAQLLADIELIVDQSTTYKAVGASTVTLIDRTMAAPQGVPDRPRYAVFLRQRGDEAGFRACVRALADGWAQTAGVARVRLSLFDVPDMEAEKQAGYPIKTHPLERQYQAWIDLVVDAASVAAGLLRDAPGLADHVAEIHAYPVEAHYCFVYGGIPTLVGLRGYAAYQAINGLDAANARQPALLRWMYGAVVKDGLQT
jgi:hypothetical protein